MGKLQDHVRSIRHFIRLQFTQMLPRLYLKSSINIWIGDVEVRLGVDLRKHHPPTEAVAFVSPINFSWI